MVTENTAVPTATKTTENVESPEMVALREKNAVLESTIEQLTTENTQIKAQLENKGSIKILKETNDVVTLPKGTFTYEGKDYRFVLPAFRIPINGVSTKVLAATALKDDDIIEIIMSEYKELVEAV
jgi:hypothetical protein